MKKLALTKIDRGVKLSFKKKCSPEGQNLPCDVQISFFPYLQKLMPPPLQFLNMYFTPCFWIWVFFYFFHFVDVTTCCTWERRRTRRRRRWNNGGDTGRQVISTRWSSYLYFRINHPTRSCHFFLIKNFIFNLSEWKWG